MISGFHIYSSVPRFPRFELNFFGKIAVVSAYHFWFEAAVFSFHLCNEHIIFFVSYCWRPYCYHLFLLRYLISWQKISSFIFHIFKLCRWTIPGFIEPILTALPRFCVIVLVWRLCEIGLTNCYVCAFFCVNSCWHTKYHIYRTQVFWFEIFWFFYFSHLSCCQRLVTIQDAILHQLHDDDLTVVQAALSIDGLPGMISPSDLLEGLNDVLKRCVIILMSSEYGLRIWYAFDCSLFCAYIPFSHFSRG